MNKDSPFVVETIMNEVAAELKMMEYVLQRMVINQQMMVLKFLCNLILSG